MCGKPFFHFLKTGKCDDRLVLPLHKNTDVFAHTFYIADIINIDADYPAIAFHKQRIAFYLRSISQFTLLLQQFIFKLFAGLIRRLQ